MSDQDLAPVRRIVTGVNPAGRSCVVQEGVSPAMQLMPGRKGYRNNNIWRTLRSPAPVDATDTVLEHTGVLPPPRGTVLRVIDIRPKAPIPRRPPPTRGNFRHAVSRCRATHHAQHPGMHRTETVDYAIVLEGEIVAMLEDSEPLKAGDILIQRGTNHAWANRSTTGAHRFVLIDGVR